MQLAVTSWYNHPLKGLKLVVHFRFCLEQLRHNRFLVALFLHLEDGMVRKEPFDKHASHPSLGRGGEEEFDATGNQPRYSGGPNMQEEEMRAFRGELGPKG